MSTLKVLKEYLVGEGGYLLNPDNNGKTVMLSGAWGSGKTHFWQKKIEENLTKELNKKNKACVYVSLYGKDNIEAIKNEILFKAHESIKDENKIAKRAISAFGFTSRLLSVSYGGARANTGAVGDVVENFFESKKINEAESFLADGGLICLDDFERKSKHIDLNDLFGFIAQLAIDMNCKIVIILNSDVFEDEEVHVFKTVKEKTVNKFFYFEPTIEELFNSIYNSNDKYNKLDECKDEILKTIEESEELNARIYIQSLDNCLEWIDRGHDENSLRVLVLNTICFIKNNFILGYPVYTDMREANSDSMIEVMAYNEFRASSDISWFIIKQFPLKSLNEGYTTINKISELHDSIISFIGEHGGSEVEKDNMLSEIEKNYKYYMQIIIFGYKLYVSKDINEGSYNEVTMFIKSGILLPNKEKSS